MNEWKCCFFSGAGKKKNSSEIEWMNGQRTFPRAKKKQKICRKFSGKDKKSTCFFFPRFRKKKNTIFGFGWMNGQRPCPRKKKIRYLCFKYGNNFKIMIFRQKLKVLMWNCIYFPFFPFLFNFLSYPLSNFGFPILLSWLSWGIPPCPRACGPRVWRGDLL